jgi:hypothetical protein
MKKSLLSAFAVLAFAPLSVQASDLEVGLLVDKEVGKAQAFAAGVNPSRNYDAVSPTGVGFRAAYTFLDLKVAGLGAAVTYHPKAEADLVAGGTNYGKLGNQYVAVGLQADWKFLVNLHAGVDYRSEKLTAPVVAGGSSDSTTYGRTWVKAGLGFSVPTPIVQPFVRVEVAAPITTSSTKSGNDDDLRKALAPSFQVALYGGIRF